MGVEDIVITQAEFSRRIGVTKKTVSEYVKTGIVPLNSDEKIPFQAGIRAYNKHVRDLRRRGVSGKRLEPVNEKQLLRMYANENAGTDAAPENVNVALTKAKLAEKTYQARLKELDYKARTGALLDRDEVEAEAAALAEKVRAKLLAVPPRISSLCEGRIARDIEEIISDGINDALKDLQKLKGGAIDETR